MQVSNPWTPFFLDSLPNTSTLACVFFKFQWQQLEWSSRCGELLLLENPKFMWRKAPQRSHKRFTQTVIWATIQLSSNQDFREVWVQNPKTKRGTRGILISLSLQSQKRGLGFPLYSGRSRSETLILNGLKLLFGPTYNSADTIFDWSSLFFDRSNQAEYEIFFLQLVCSWILTWITLSIV